MRVDGDGGLDELEATNVDWEPRFLPNIVRVGEEEGNAGKGLEFGQFGWVYEVSGLRCARGG